MTEDDWQLQKQHDEIHLEYYEIQDIDTLRKKLIEDIWNLVNSENRFCDCKVIIKSEVENIINRRFGVND